MPYSIDQACQGQLLQYSNLLQDYQPKCLWQDRHATVKYCIQPRPQCRYKKTLIQASHPGTTLLDDASNVDDRDVRAETDE